MIDTTLALFGAAILGAALVLSLVIERLTRAFGADPADEADKSRGFRDVLSKIGSWLQNRSSTDRSNRS